MATVTAVITTVIRPPRRTIVTGSETITTAIVIVMGTVTIGTV